MIKKITPLLLIVALLVSLTGCNQNQAQESQPAKAEKVTIILDWFPNTNHTGLYAAKDQGYYAEQGLNVEILQPGDAGTAQLVAAGQGDFGVSYQEEVTVARSKEIPIVALAAVIQHNTSGFASPIDKNIKTPADFEGKTYGGWGSPAETAMIKALMNKYNADFNKVNMVNIGSADFFTSIQKNIDFAWIFWGWTGIEAELKNIDLNFVQLKDEHEALDFYTPVLIANEDMIKNKPELVKKFMQATAKGYEFAMQNPDKAAQILLQDVPELNKELVVASQKYLAKEYQSDATRWGEMKPEVWKKYADFMYENKLIDKNIDPSKAFTNEFLPE
ncbi:MAG: ABC transporter substrate-binding protein [Syntrophomonadaceae bacterium]|nr:ABC transporter substrate-binding protein [Syntrophomonadaceae bacterium]MDD3889672.1 ABC transporter substrate-binding protein [Syntrophomonadaceae bacterium]MDD4548701.1 ABC transporter substrate-binding protein [Syntrophomonadaceae bacterium]